MTAQDLDTVVSAVQDAIPDAIRVQEKCGLPWRAVVLEVIIALRNVGVITREQAEIRRD